VKGHYNRTAEALLAVVENDVLAGRRAGERRGKRHFGAARAGRDPAVDIRLAVAHLRSAGELRGGRRAADPVRRRRREASAVQSGVLGALNDHERVAREVLAGDEPWRIVAVLATADAEPTTLAKRIALKTAMPPDHRAMFGLDRARLPWQPAADKIAEGSLADEAYARRIALVGDRQPALARDAPHLGLGEAADRELARSELRGIERVQEVALVLGTVDAAHQPPAIDARVVTGCKAFGTQSARVVEADAKLHLAVAEHVGIRRATGCELGQEMIEHTRAILGSEAHLVQGYAELLRDGPGVLEIGGGRAVAVVVLGPVGHEKRLDTSAGIHEEQGSDRGVHAARHRHDHPGHGSARSRAKCKPVKRDVIQQFERVARAAQVVIDAQRHERAAVFRQARGELLAVEPERANDRAVEKNSGQLLVNLSRKRNSKDHPPGRALPLVDAGHRLRREPAPRLFAGLTNHRVEE